MALSTTNLMKLSALVNGYAIAVDERDFARLSTFFTPDATLELPEPLRHLEPVRLYRGRDAVLDALRAVDAFRYTRHAVLAVMFTADGSDTARGTVSAEAHHVAERAGRDAEDVVWHLRYRDRYRHDGPEWRIAERRLEIDWIERRAVQAVRISSSIEPDDQ